jgi:hypothetical protein
MQQMQKTDMEGYGYVPHHSPPRGHEGLDYNNYPPTYHNADSNPSLKPLGVANHHSRNSSQDPLAPLPPRSGSPTPSELQEINEPLLPPGWYKQPKYIGMSFIIL